MPDFTKETMHKFTKGTWSYIDVSTPYERNFIIGTTTPDGLLFPHGSARKEADARLFAAAPELVKELYYALGYVVEAHGIATDPHYKSIAWNDIQRIEALLARIDGKEATGHDTDA